MVDKANFLDALDKIKNISLFSSAHCIVNSSTALHKRACFTIKLISDVFTKIQLEGWLAEEQKCQSPSHLRLSFTSHGFDSPVLLPLLGLPLLILHFSILLLSHSFHILSPAAQKAHAHIIFPLPTSEQPQPHFSHFSPQGIQLPRLTQSLLLKFSLDPGSL